MRWCHNVLQITVILYEVSGVVAQSGEWTEWGQWSSCSTTCGYGIQKRRRSWKMADPARSNSKNGYTYDDIVECITKVQCPIDGNWSFWGAWSECTEMCNGGTTTRKRECDAPKPQNDGKDCDGKSAVTTTCNTWTCPDLPPNFNITKCNETTFMCQSRKQCIPAANHCDDALQCHDGSDEHKCHEYYWTNGSGTRSFSALWLTAMLLILSVVPL